MSACHHVTENLCREERKRKERGKEKPLGVNHILIYEPQNSKSTNGQVGVAAAAEELGLSGDKTGQRHKFPLTNKTECERERERENAGEELPV